MTFSYLEEQAYRSRGQRLRRDDFADMAALHLFGRQGEASSSETEMPVLTNPGPTVNAAIWSVGTVSTLFLFLRVYCKQVRAKGMWWDDYLLTVSWVCSLLGTPCGSSLSSDIALVNCLFSDSTSDVPDSRQRSHH
jgi:hypothetical protein